MAEQIATIDATGSGATPQEPTTPATGEETTPATPAETTPAEPTKPAEATTPEKDVIGETKGIAATRDELLADVTRLRAEKRLLTGEEPVKPSTEGVKTPETTTPSPESELVTQMRTEQMGLALKEIYKDPDFHLIDPAKDPENKNWSQVKQTFEALFPKGFTTKEGYHEGLTRAYAAAFPTQYAEAAANKAREAGQLEGAGLRSADIGGKSSGLKNETSATLSAEDRKMLAVHNKNKPAEKQMTEAQFVEFRDGVKDPEFAWKK